MVGGGRFYRQISGGAEALCRGVYGLHDRMATFRRVGQCGRLVAELVRPSAFDASRAEGDEQHIVFRG